MTKISETLTAAKAIIENPERWTQYYHAINAASQPVLIDAPDATCFCADAAIAKAAGVKIRADGKWIDTDHYDEVAELLRGAAFNLTGHRSYVNINDGHFVIPFKTAHEATLMVFDKGIEVAKEREQFNWSEVAT
jgi:hypothetical protein